MRRGPKPKPTHLKVIAGNPGKRPLGNEPKPPVGLPDPPEGMDEATKAVWLKLAAELESVGIATTVDALAFEMMVRSYADMQAAALKVASLGPVWMERAEETGKIPKFVYSPYWVVQNKEWKKLVQMLTEFGMTPSSRTRLAASKIPSDDDDLESFKVG
jgi:P27 family predicted phage terminase small subunit